MTPLAPNYNDVGCVLCLFFHDQRLEATNLVDAVNIEIGGSGGAVFDMRSLRIVSCLSFFFMSTICAEFPNVCCRELTNFQFMS